MNFIYTDVPGKYCCLKWMKKDEVFHFFLFQSCAIALQKTIELNIATE